MNDMSNRPVLPPEVDLTHVVGEIGGYHSLMVSDPDHAPDITSDDYAREQASGNERKTLNYLMPLVQSRGAQSVLDVGCGIGTMVRTFLDRGYSAYGVDLFGLHKHWRRLQLPADRMFVIDPVTLQLPFRTGSLDFIFTLGVIEHVGTSNGLSHRRADYHEVRQVWLRELYRVLKPGGSMLIAGPNRRFPADAAHDLDMVSAPWERWLSRKLGVSVHRTWGEYFLWTYDDIPVYLHGLPHAIEALSIKGFIEFSRVPALVKPLVRFYVDRLPRALLHTGFNPWMMALVSKPAATGPAP